MLADHDKETLTRMYRLLFTARKFDEKVIELFRRGKEVMPGFVHSGQGMEAIPVGACLALRNDDYVLITHRGYGHIIAKGVSLDRLLAEICGRSTGLCKGKGGFHPADASIGVLGMPGILGGGFVLAAGAGLSAKLKGREQVVVCFFGDGASHEGNFHTGLNLAALWKLPVVFVCENNYIASSTPLYQKKVLEGYVHWGSIAGKSIADRASAYGMPGQIVDGQDVVAVYETVKEAVARARTGMGPTLVECRALKYRPHAEGYGAWAISEEELQEALAKDPVKKLRTSLLETKVLRTDEIDDVEKEAIAEIEAAEKFALQSPFPMPEEALEDLYA